MPETEGTTCTSCFTLNPPGAPSCIRCNQPLPATAPTNGPAASPADPASPAKGPAAAPGAADRPRPGGAGGATVRPAARRPGEAPGPTDWPGGAGGAGATGATDWPGEAGAAGAGGAGGAGGATTRPAAGGAGRAGGAAGPTDWPGAAGGTGAAGVGDRPGAGQPGGAEPAEGAGAGVRPGEYNFPAPTPTPRGLAVPPKGAPGESRSAAVPVQPPGYGMGAGDVGGTPVEMSPAEQRRISRRIAIVGGILVVLVLAIGGGALWLTRPKYLDVDPVAAGIGTALTQRAGETVIVRCQGSPRLKAGETFTCTATDRHGVARMVEVTVLDASGRYEWTLG